MATCARRRFTRIPWGGSTVDYASVQVLSVSGAYRLGARYLLGKMYSLLRYTVYHIHGALYPDRRHVHRAPVTWQAHGRGGPHRRQTNHAAVTPVPVQVYGSTGWEAGSHGRFVKSTGNSFIQKRLSIATEESTDAPYRLSGAIQPAELRALSVNNRRCGGRHTHTRMRALPAAAAAAAAAVAAVLIRRRRSHPTGIAT